MSDWQKTTCAFCAVNCGLEVQTAGNRITKVRVDKDSPRSPGYACRKGLSIGYFQDHADRLTHPLKRVGDAFEKIPWEQAITEIAVKLEEIVGAHGARSLALFGLTSDRHFERCVWELVPGRKAIGDSDGTLWLGTDNGIVHFDGTDTTRYTVPAEMAPPAAPSFSLEPTASAAGLVDAELHRVLVGGDQ